MEIGNNLNDLDYAYRTGAAHRAEVILAKTLQLLHAEVHLLSSNKSQIQLCLKSSVQHTLKFWKKKKSWRPACWELYSNETVMTAYYLRLLIWWSCETCKLCCGANCLLGTLKVQMLNLKTCLNLFFAFLFPLFFQIKILKIKTFSTLHLTLSAANSPQPWRKSLSNKRWKETWFHSPCNLTNIISHSSFSQVQHRNWRKEVRQRWVEQRWGFDSRGGIGFSFDPLPCLSCKRCAALHPVSC